MPLPQSEIHRSLMREEHEVSTENDTKTEPRRTVAALIKDAVRVVNWRPSDEAPQQARYDAAKALSSIYAYWTTVTMETLHRIDPAAAERVADHIDDDTDWQYAHEHAYGWEQALAAGNPIPVDAWPFPEVTGQAEEPAGEQHTGTLNLTGEGQPQGAVDQLAEIADWEAPKANEPAAGAPKDWPHGYLPCGCCDDGNGRHVR
jgi:hypothetical protein